MTSKMLTTLSNEQYHAESLHMSSSNLKTLLKDPQEFYKTKILGQREERKESSAFVEGSFLHSLILEPELVLEQYHLFPGLNRRGPEWTKFEEEHQDHKPILTMAQQLRVKGWVDQYNKHKTAVSLVEGASYEQSLFTNLNGVNIKVRADIINPEKGYIADLKTTSGGIELEFFKESMDRWGYGLSAALYVKCFEQYYKRPFDFYFVVLGKKDLGCEVYKLSQTTRELGELEIQKAISIYKRCLASGDWTTKPKYVSMELDEVQEV